MFNFKPTKFFDLKSVDLRSTHCKPTIPIRPFLPTKPRLLKVGENLPCASENTAPWSPMAGYDHDTGYDGMQDMDIETFTQDIDWAANAVYDSRKYETKEKH